MIDLRRAAVPAALAALAATALPAPDAIGSVPPVRAATAAAPGVETLTGSFELQDDYGYGWHGTVLVEPGLGRLQVASWRDDFGIWARFLHVTLGRSEESGCQPVYRLVLDELDWDAAVRVHDAAGAPVPVSRTFEVDHGWSDTHVERLELGAPHALDEVDCVYAESFSGPDPAAPGPVQHPSAGVDDLSTLPGFVRETSPAKVVAPRAIPYAEPFDIRTGYDTYLPWLDEEEYLTPSTAGSITFTVDPGPHLELVSAPQPMTDVDLWAEPADFVTTTVRLVDPSLVHRAELPAITISIDGAETVHDYGSRPVSMPPPTDWEGTLAGESWWQRDEWLTSGSSARYYRHQVYEFLDDEWVHVWGKDGYQGPWTEPCAEVAATNTGCHRYYFDEATEQLQIDDRRIRRSERGTGWELPFGTFRRDRQILPVETGRRFAYEGKGTRQNLVLRRGGTFRYEWRAADGRRAWSGRYKLVGGEAQELVLRLANGRVRRAPVTLYFGVHKGRQRLFDLESGPIAVHRYDHPF